jgi:hypothetical protein
VAGTLCGVVRLALTYSVWGASWTDSWRFDLVVEGLSGMAFGIALSLLARATAGRVFAAGLYLGAQGLATLALVYLQLALRFTGWRPTDAPAQLWAVGALTVCGTLVLLARVHTARYAALELGAVLLALVMLVRWHWALASLAVLGLILVRALGTLVTIRTNAP